MPTPEINAPILSYDQDKRGGFLALLSNPTAWNILAVSMVLTGSLLRIYASRLPMADGMLYFLGWLITYFGLIPNLLYLIDIPIRRLRKIPLVHVHWFLKYGSVTFALIAYLILTFRIPRQLFFKLNQSKMDAWVTSMQASGSPPNINTSASIGLYDCWIFEPIPDGFRCLVSGSGFFRAGGGFAYCPGSAPVQSESAAEEIYTHAGGNWYFYEMYKP